MSKAAVSEELPDTPEKREKRFSGLRGRVQPTHSESVQNLSFGTPKLRDLSAARMERKQMAAQPTTSLSSDNISTAFKVQKVARDWTLMKQGFSKDFESVNMSQISFSENESSASAVRLVNVLKASSAAEPTKQLNRSMSVATSKKMLFKRKAASPLRAATPQQGNTLLSKLMKFSGHLALSTAEYREKKPPRKPRPVIEVSLFSSRGAATPSQPAPTSIPKPEKRKPRLIEVTMSKT